MGAISQSFASFSGKAWEAQEVLNKANKALTDNNNAQAANAKAIEYASMGMNEAAHMMAEYASSLYDTGDKAAEGMRKLKAAMAEYRNQTNPNQVSQQVNITTGPVTQMGGTNYVTQQDLQNATSSAAKQGASMALSQLQNNPKIGRAVGVK
jgi:hypothetical protein